MKKQPNEIERRLHPEAGVTLVEMMVVIVIIGLVTAIVVINVLPAQDTARVRKAGADIAQLQSALELYRLDHGRFPTAEQGLEELLPAHKRKNAVAAAPVNPGDAKTAGYIPRLPDDPWGREYLYVVPGQEGRPFDLYSLGADGREGGEGPDADIGNWE